MSQSTTRRAESPAIETIYTLMGRLLGMPLSSEADALRVSRTGIPASHFVAVAKRLNLSVDAIGAPSTMRRRLKNAAKFVRKDEHGHLIVHVHDAAGREETESPETTSEDLLTPVESERLVRLARVYSEATQLFGDEQAALAWLNTPADYLQDDNPTTPMKLAESDSGARIVEALLQRTAYGMF
jgi:hypothetical protein